MNRRPFCPILQCLEEVSPDSSSIGALDFGTACWACGRPWARRRRHFLHGPVDSLYHLSNLIRVSLNPWFKQVDCVGLILLFGPELNKERHEQLFSNLRMPKNHNLFWRFGRLDHPQWAIWIPKVAGSSFLSTEENTFPSWPRSIPNSTIFCGIYPLANESNTWIAWSSLIRHSLASSWLSNVVGKWNRCLAVERHVCVFEKSQMLKVATT